MAVAKKSPLVADEFGPNFMKISIKPDLEKAKVACD